MKHKIKITAIIYDDTGKEEKTIVTNIKKEMYDKLIEYHGGIGNDGMIDFIVDNLKIQLHKYLKLNDDNK